MFMKKVAIILSPKDFRDETASLLKTQLQKWNLSVFFAGYNNTECIGSHGAVYKQDLSALKVNPAEFDALVIVEGKGVESFKMYDFRPLLDTVRAFSMAKKPIFALANAFKIIARANAIVNTKVAAPEDEESQRLLRIYHGIPSENPIEFDNNVLTAKDSESAASAVNLFLQVSGVK